MINCKRLKETNIFEKKPGSMSAAATAAAAEGEAP